MADLCLLKSFLDATAFVNQFAACSLIEIIELSHATEIVNLKLECHSSDILCFVMNKTWVLSPI
jgi:hypothetical protein